MAPVGIKTVSFSFLKNLFLFTVIIGFPWDIVQCSDLWWCFWRLIDDLELTVNSKSSISLQKHYHRSEHWMISQGKPKITINKNKFFKKKNETVFIPTGAIHRIENNFKKPVKIIEVQIGAILRESDIVRYQDIYGRIK